MLRFIVHHASFGLRRHYQTPLDVTDGTAFARLDAYLQYHTLLIVDHGVRVPASTPKAQPVRLADIRLDQAIWLCLKRIGIEQVRSNPQCSAIARSDEHV